MYGYGADGFHSEGGFLRTIQEIPEWPNVAILVQPNEDKDPSGMVRAFLNID